MISKAMYLQFGSGPNNKLAENWLHVDASPWLILSKIGLQAVVWKITGLWFDPILVHGNIVSGIRGYEEKCDLVFCSHVLEHLSYHDFQRALKNTYKLLKNGGTFRLIMPDLQYYITGYLNSCDTENRAVNFVRGIGMGHERQRGIIPRFKSLFSNAQHLWMWDFSSVEKELKAIGFINIRRCYFGDSEHRPFQDVEKEERFASGFGIECKKEDLMANYLI